ncbi:late embryogenesis abundant protein 2-like [Aristolochia californica]|uniref:late embryogenesis abundant protein 2-like n=1 Tax=Aristolochia californica TaxID=171875 RepID=UPI0035D82E9B
MAESKQMFKAGQSHGQTQEKTNQAFQSAKDTAQAAADKMSNAAQSTKESAERGADSASGFLQQTGEQAMHMAQGAIDGVKNTLGMGENTTSTTTTAHHSTNTRL